MPVGSGLSHAKYKAYRDVKSLLQKLRHARRLGFIPVQFSRIENTALYFIQLLAPMYRHQRVAIQNHQTPVLGESSDPLGLLLPPQLQ